MHFKNTCFIIKMNCKHRRQIQDLHIVCTARTMATGLSAQIITRLNCALTKYM